MKFTVVACKKARESSICSLHSTYILFILTPFMGSYHLWGRCRVRKASPVSKWAAEKLESTARVLVTLPMHYGACFPKYHPWAYIREELVYGQRSPLCFIYQHHEGTVVSFLCSYSIWKHCLCVHRLLALPLLIAVNSGSERSRLFSNLLFLLIIYL